MGEIATCSVVPEMPAAALGWGDQVLQMPPFLIGQVTWIAQLVSVVPRTVLRCPHHTHRELISAIESQKRQWAQAPELTDSKDSESFRTDT